MSSLQVDKKKIRIVLLRGDKTKAWILQISLVCSNKPWAAVHNSVCLNLSLLSISLLFHVRIAVG